MGWWSDDAEKEEIKDGYHKWVRSRNKREKFLNDIEDYKKDSRKYLKQKYGLNIKFVTAIDSATDIDSIDNLEKRIENSDDSYKEIINLTRKGSNGLSMFDNFIENEMNDILDGLDVLTKNTAENNEDFERKIKVIGRESELESNITKHENDVIALSELINNLELEKNEALR